MCQTSATSNLSFSHAMSLMTEDTDIDHVAWCICPVQSVKPSQYRKFKHSLFRAFGSVKIWNSGIDVLEWLCHNLLLSWLSEYAKWPHGSICWCSRCSVSIWFAILDLNSLQVKWEDSYSLSFRARSILINSSLSSVKYNKNMKNFNLLCK